MKTTRQTKQNAADESRFVCDNWDRPTVNVQSQGRGVSPARKVITRGVESIDCGATIEAASALLRQGKEVRLRSKDQEDAIRLIPMIDAKTNKMYVDARTLKGSFRDKTLADKTARFVRRGTEVSAETVDSYADMKKAETPNGAGAEVTPDSTVKCPKCGCRFRVGRRLAA